MKKNLFVTLSAISMLIATASQAQQTGPNDSPICGPTISSCGDCDPQIGGPIFSSTETGTPVLTASIPLGGSTFYRSSFRVGVQLNCGTATGDNSINISMGFRYYPTGENPDVRMRLGGVLVTPFDWVYLPNPDYTLYGISNQPLSGALTGNTYQIAVPVTGYALGFAQTSSNWFSDEENQPPSDIIPSNSGQITNLTITMALPIKLTSFTAVNAGNNTAKLSWTSSFEQNANEYEVEYSRDGRSFRKVGTVKAVGNASGNTTYMFTHPGLVNGSNFYRLRMVDMDNSFSYSSVANIKVTDKGEENTMNVYPNPAKAYTTVSFTNSYRGKATIIITDAAGKRVSATQTQVNAGTNVKQIQTINMASGTYLVSLFGENGTKLGTPQRLIVNND